jgi:hypothetical protein
LNAEGEGEREIDLDAAADMATSGIKPPDSTTPRLKDFTNARGHADKFLGGALACQRERALEHLRTNERGVRVLG